MILFSIVRNTVRLLCSASAQCRMDAAITSAVASAPAPPLKLSYGTAGFRAVHDVLDGVFVRCGILAALRSASLSSAVIGVMITASHNPIEDNGVKMVDPDGGMLAPAWEKYACELAHAMDAGAVQAVLSRIAAAEGIALPLTTPANVAIACDTRPSSERLKERVRVGAAALGARILDFGVLTTPQLHHLVRCENDSKLSKYGSESGYYTMLAEAFEDIIAADVTGKAVDPAARGPLMLDCAHGVGGAKAAELAKYFSRFVGFDLRNVGATAEDLSRLNDGVGAEHAQKLRLPPAGFTPEACKGQRCASLDGDADRLVYHYFDGDVWKLVDGDKIATLAAVFLSDQLHSLGLNITPIPTHPHGDHGAHAHGHASASADVSVGIVQTAYANGASSNYIRDHLKLPIRMAKTGVKFVHHAAQEFDIGVYFEANGHGTVLFHSSFVERLTAMDAEALSPAQALARRRLLAASRLINQAVGDALSDAMFVEAVLALKGWSIADWDAIYTDLPSRQLKLAVPDRSAVKTSEDESRVISPIELQNQIDALVDATTLGRAFIRPSGTEDVVRVYAEASTQEQADNLANDVQAAAGAILNRP